MEMNQDSLGQAMGYSPTVSHLQVIFCHYQFHFPSVFKGTSHRGDLTEIVQDQRIITNTKLFANEQLEF